jgi:hypothetical protein
MEILLGCGRNHAKKLYQKDDTDWKDLVTVDISPDVGADIVHDLSVLPLPLGDNVADEIHAYEVMEHTGQQGDWKFFFDQWSDIWRVLKPGGWFYGTSPDCKSRWAWGDPGHTRIVGLEQLTFLNQPEYEKQCGKTPMTDYRFCYKADFDFGHLKTYADGTFVYILQAVKPSRCEL